MTVEKEEKRSEMKSEKKSNDKENIHSKYLQPTFSNRMKSREKYNP